MTLTQSSTETGVAFVAGQTLLLRMCACEVCFELCRWHNSWALPISSPSLCDWCKGAWCQAGLV